MICTVKAVSLLGNGSETWAIMSQGHLVKQHEYHYHNDNTIQYTITGNYCYDLQKQSEQCELLNRIHHELY